MRLKIYKKSHPSIGKVYNGLGNAKNATGKIDEAKECYQKAYKIFLSSLGEKHQHTKLLAKKLKDLNDQ